MKSQASGLAQVLQTWDRRNAVKSLPANDKRCIVVGFARRRKSHSVARMGIAPERISVRLSPENKRRK
jgi:hypothetical protein